MNSRRDRQRNLDEFIGWFGMTVSSIAAAFYHKLTAVMEYWSDGVLGKFEWILLLQFFTFPRYSIPPTLLRNPHCLVARLSRGIISFGYNLLIIFYRR
jgi:hypothetical protein